jgi:nitrogenase subunit NifH
MVETVTVENAVEETDSKEEVVTDLKEEAEIEDSMTEATEAIEETEAIEVIEEIEEIEETEEQKEMGLNLED